MLVDRRVENGNEETHQTTALGSILPDGRVEEIVMAKTVFACYIMLFGLPLLWVGAPAFNPQWQPSLETLPPKAAAIRVVLPRGKAFEPISRLVEQRQYIAAVERLARLPQTNSHAAAARQRIIVQYQQQALAALPACAHGFDPEDLKQSSFYRTAKGSYIAQVECYFSTAQPAYEYYLYNELFEPTAGALVQQKFNFVTGSPAFNQRTQALTVRRKYGDKGDCGTIGDYHFEQNQFVLKQFVADFQCGDGKLQYQPLYAQKPITNAALLPL